ncbi:MAG TPA: hypothetical protein VK472_04850 [Allosphingosinicella sp.]|nr:hypothetical protein [Allosphingosinicella sp.]
MAEGEGDVLAKRITIATFAALLTLAASPLSAADPEEEPYSFDKRQFTCPLGGARFEHDVGYFTYPLVTFPDGSYPGDEGVDAELPACPGSGLLILPDFEASSAAGGMAYSQYSADELARLPALIADPAYRAAAGDGRHMQAYWLASKLGRPADLRFALLQRSTWAAVDPALRRKLVERLVEEGPALIRSSGDPDSAKRIQLYLIVNGLRELGRFDEALALLERIESEGPAVPAPVDPDSIYGPGAYAPQMRAAIAEKDMDRFPVGLMPPKWAGSICSGEDHRPPYGPLSATTKAACARRQAELTRRYAQEEKTLDEMSALLEDRAALDRACVATPAAERRGGLEAACETIERERDSAAGDAMAKDGPALAAACEATPQDRLEGPLFHACISYEGALTSALESALAEDEAGYVILCPNDGALAFPDRASIVSVACGGAARRRYEMKIDRMVADSAALDRQCVGIDPGALSDLALACAQRAGDLEQAERERIAGDDNAFAEKCGRFRRRLSEPEDFLADEDDELRSCRILKHLRDSKVYQVSSDASLPDDIFADTSSLMIEARARAAAMIARAKAEGAYPKRRPGDRD